MKCKIIATKKQLKVLGIDYDITDLDGVINHVYNNGYCAVDVRAVSLEFDIPRKYLMVDMSFSEFMIYCLEKESKISRSPRIELFNIFRRLILENQDKFNKNVEYCLRDYNSVEQAQYAFHKSLRQNDVFDNANIDMMFYNFLNINSTSDFLHKVMEFYKENKGDKLQEKWNFRPL